MSFNGVLFFFFWFFFVFFFLVFFVVVVVFLFVFRFLVLVAKMAKRNYFNTVLVKGHKRKTFLKSL